MIDNSKSVAFLGMGIMGSAMASNLAKAGYQVKVWNRTSGKPLVKEAVAAGCLEATSIKDCVEETSLVFTCLGDTVDVEEVLLASGGVSEHALANALVVDFSTIGPIAATSFSSALREAGLRFLDAPVTGGDVGARAGTLTIMVGGDAQEDYEEVLPLLQVMGKTVHLCGKVGSGQALKLCNQVLCAVNMSAVSEAIVLARKFDIDPSLVVEVLKGGAGGSWALSTLGARIIEDDLSPGFMLKHMLKDLRLVHENSASKEIKLPAMEMAESMFKQLVESDESAAEGLGTQAMIKVYES